MVTHASLAQSVERLHGKEKVNSSILLGGSVCPGQGPAADDKRATETALIARLIAKSPAAGEPLHLSDSRWPIELQVPERPDKAYFAIRPSG